MAWAFNPFTGKFDYFEKAKQIKSGTVPLPAFGAINIESVDLSDGSQYKLYLRIYSDDFEVYKSMEATIKQIELNEVGLIIDNFYTSSNFDVQLQPTGIISNVSIFVQSNFSRDVTVSYVRIFHA